MEKKDFSTLPKEAANMNGRPRKTTEFLGDYYKGLGDGKAELLGINTGFTKLNEATLGLDGVVVLGGIAGAGKTSFALQLALAACQLTPTLFYSLEMPRQAILTKILNRFGVKYRDILLKGRHYLTGQQSDAKYLSNKEARDLEMGRKFLEERGGKFYIRSRDRGEERINFETVKREINFLKAEHKTERVFVVIDYLQVFDVGDYKDQIDKDGKLINGFRQISDETGATILLISQKNKQGFTSTDLQTIKGSADIVYLADVVMFLDTDREKKRREARKQKSYYPQWQDDDIDSTIETYESKEEIPIDLVIGKNRYNTPTLIKLQFNGKYSVFSEML